MLEFLPVAVVQMGDDKGLDQTALLLSTSSVQEVKVRRSDDSAGLGWHRHNLIKTNSKVADGFIRHEYTASSHRDNIKVKYMYINYINTVNYL